MKRRWLPGLSALAALGGFLTAPARVAGQSVSAQGTAAAVNTPLAGGQTFANATLPSSGGMSNADLDAANVASTLGAQALTSITTGQIDSTLVSASATSEAAQVSILSGVISARLVLAVATSYANGAAATSETTGSMLFDLAVNGLSYGDIAPAVNTRLDLPGVGYVVLNEQLPSGDGVHTTGLTVNMIHVHLTDPVTGTPTGDIVVGTAQTAASL